MPARNSRGRFVKGGRRHYTRRRSSPGKLGRSSSKALARREVQIVRVNTGGGSRRRHHSRRRHSGGGEGTSLKALATIAGLSAGLGWFETQKADTFAKIPTAAGLPREVIIGGVAYVFRRKSKWLNRIAAAAFGVAGYKFGAAGFKLSGDDEY